MADIRITNGAIKVEERSDPDIRVTNGQIGVEERNVKYLRVTNGQIGVEERIVRYLRVTNCAIMVEYHYPVPPPSPAQRHFVRCCRIRMIGVGGSAPP